MSESVPYGSLPGESPTYLQRIPDSVWHALHRINGFKEWWWAPAKWDTTRYKLTVAAYCVTEGNEDQTRTILWIWHRKHGRVFDESEWARYVRDNARKKAGGYIGNRKREAYRKSVLEIMEDPAHELHVKLWISYLLDTAESAQLEAMCRVTGLPVGQVGSVLKELEVGGKAKLVDGRWFPVPSARWDRLDLDETLTGIKWNDVKEEGLVNRMRCFDVRSGTFQDVLYDRYQVFRIEKPEEIEWVIDFDGEVVARDGVGPFPLTFWDFGDADEVIYEDGNKLDCRKQNVRRMFPPSGGLNV